MSDNISEKRLEELMNFAYEIRHDEFEEGVTKITFFIETMEEFNRTLFYFGLFKGSVVSQIISENFEEIGNGGSD